MQYQHDDLISEYVLEGVQDSDASIGITHENRNGFCEVFTLCTTFQSVLPEAEDANQENRTETSSVGTELFEIDDEVT